MLSKEISEFIKKLVKENGAMVHLDKYGQYLMELSNLSELLDKYTKPIADKGLPKLKEEDYDRLKQSYNRAIKAGRIYVEAVQSEPNKQNADVNRVNLVSDFENLLAKDFAVLNNTISVNDKTFIDVIRESRGVKLSVSGRDISALGEASSERIPVTYTAENGEKHIGFFTETKYRNDSKSMKDLMSAMTKDHPEYADIMKDLMDGETFKKTYACSEGGEQVIENDLEGEISLTNSINGFVDEIIRDKTRNLQDDKEKAKITRKYEKIKQKIDGDEEFATRFYFFVKGFASIDGLSEMYDSYPKIEQGSNLGDRNVAMSQVASMLGIPNSIAKSVKMKLVVDGVEKDGSFMTFANGSDINRLKPDDPITRIDEKGLNNPEAFKSIADLQVLDFICGNTDRHAGNIFYQTSETPEGVKLTGIVGIDNDCSFGKLVPGNENVNKLVGIDNMLVISKDQADKIKSMTKDMLEIRLKDLELSKEEINAAWDRVQHLKDAITVGKKYFAKHTDVRVKPGLIRVVADHEWSNYNLYDLAKEGDVTRNNYFGTVKLIPSNIVYKRRVQESKDEFREFLREAAPRLVQEKAPFRIAQAAVVRENNEAGMNDTRKQLQQFDARRRKANSGAFIGSKEFDKVMEQFKSLKLVANHLPANARTKAVDILVDEYRKLKETLNIYIDKKEGQRIKKGHLDKKSQERLTFAKDLLDFTNIKMKNMEEEAKLASAELKAYLAANNKAWDEMVSGQPYSKELKELLAKDVVMLNMQRRPELLDRLSMNDFNSHVKAVMNSNTFKTKLHEGEFIDVHEIEKHILEEQRANKTAVKTVADKAPEVRTI